MLLTDQFVQTPGPHPHRERSRTVVDIGQAPAATSRGRRTRQIEQSVTHTLTLPSRADTLISTGFVQQFNKADI
jgi:hypothetical protein